jgi:hypothetical protein
LCTSHKPWPLLTTVALWTTQNPLTVTYVLRHITPADLRVECAQLFAILWNRPGSRCIEFPERSSLFDLLTLGSQRRHTLNPWVVGSSPTGPTSLHLSHSPVVGLCAEDVVAENRRSAGWSGRRNPVRRRNADRQTAARQREPMAVGGAPPPRFRTRILNSDTTHRNTAPRRGSRAGWHPRTGPADVRPLGHACHRPIALSMPATGPSR